MNSGFSLHFPLQTSELKGGKLREVVANHKHLHLPRLSSRGLFDELCPEERFRSQRRLVIYSQLIKRILKPWSKRCSSTKKLVLTISISVTDLKKPFSHCAILLLVDCGRVPSIQGGIIHSWCELTQHSDQLGSRGGAVVRALASHQCGLGSNPGIDAICGLSLLLVLSLVPRGFSPGTPVFSSPSNSNLTRNQVDEEPLCGCATSKSLFIYLFIYSFILHCLSFVLGYVLFCLLSKATRQRRSLYSDY